MTGFADTSRRGFAHAKPDAPDSKKGVSLKAVGNSTGVSFRKEMLEAAGFKRGDELAVEASEGRITLTKSDSAYADAMAAGEECSTRYRRALDDLAK